MGHDARRQASAPRSPVATGARRSRVTVCRPCRRWPAPTRSAIRGSRRQRASRGPRATAATRRAARREHGHHPDNTRTTPGRALRGRPAAPSGRRGEPQRCGPAPGGRQRGQFPPARGVMAWGGGRTTPQRRRRCRDCAPGRTAGAGGCGAVRASGGRVAGTQRGMAPVYVEAGSAAGEKGACRWPTARGPAAAPAALSRAASTHAQDGGDRGPPLLDAAQERDSSTRLSGSAPDSTGRGAYWRVKATPAALEWFVERC
jgi:hypothetical protein